jgi:two-component system, NarL family, response regulator DesR
LVVRVLLADDNARFRGVLLRLLERDPDIVVVAEAGDGAEAVEMAEDVRPDVVLMDVSMPGLDGLEATYALKAQLPDVTVLMLSVGDKEQEIAAGLAGGASEYLVKGGPAREIVDAIKRYGPVSGPA